MRNLEVLSLKFFAARFGFNYKELSYGIAVVGDERIPSILIKGKRVFINVLEDIISPVELPGLDIKIHECSLTESPNGYVFETTGHRVVLTKDNIERYYATKYYSEATEKYVIGGNF